MPMDNRKVAQQRARGNAATTRQLRETILTGRKGQQVEVKKVSPNVPGYQGKTMFGNNAGNADYHAMYRDYILETANESSAANLGKEKRLVEVQEKIETLDREVTHSRKQKDEQQPLITEILALAARYPIIDQALTHHYVLQSETSSWDESDPIEQITSKMAELRNDMARYEPRILDALTSQVTPDIDTNWAVFEQQILQPLRDEVTQAEKVIGDMVNTRDKTEQAQSTERKSLSDTLVDERLKLSARITELSKELGEVTVQRSNKEQQWEDLRDSKAQQLATLEAQKTESSNHIQALTKDLEAARAQNQALKTTQENEATSYAKKLKELSDASDKKWEAEVKKRLAEQKAEISVNNLPTTLQILRRYIQSQFTSFGISADNIPIDDVACEWIALIDTTPTMRAEMPLGSYALTFVVSPVEVLTMQAADATVAQIWLGIKSNPDMLLSIRHFAQRADVSASQLNVLQDILLKGIRVIMEGAYRQEEFPRILVAVHALGWLYLRVGALSDWVERRSVLVNAWNDLSGWLLSNNAASEILYQVCASTFNSFGAIFGVSKGIMSVAIDKVGRLDHSNSALEEGQFLVVDPAMQMAAWAVGDSVRIFSRADVLCVNFHVGTGELTLRFRDIEMEICLCRQVAHVAHIWGWVRKLIGDDSCFRYVGM